MSDQVCEYFTDLHRNYPSQVVDGGSASAAGVKMDDVITHVDLKPVEDLPGISVIRYAHCLVQPRHCPDEKALRTFGSYIDDLASMSSSALSLGCLGIKQDFMSVLSDGIHFIYVGGFD